MQIRGYIRLGAQYPPTRQFHALASDEKSIGRYDIIRRCTMGNKLRNYHTKRLPVPSTMATKLWNRLNSVSAFGVPRSLVGYIICPSKSALWFQFPQIKARRGTLLRRYFNKHRLRFAAKWKSQRVPALVFECAPPLDCATLIKRPYTHKCEKESSLKLIST